MHIEFVFLMSCRKKPIRTVHFKRVTDKDMKLYQDVGLVLSMLPPNPLEGKITARIRGRDV